MEKQTAPSVDEWLRQAKADPDAGKVGMYLVHNGVVRATPKAQVRAGERGGGAVKGMRFSYDEAKTAAAVAEARGMEGIGYVRVWLNSGELEVGDDIMLVLIGGDIRPRVVDALQTLVGKLKNECVSEEELR